jgi:hypothetical protein
LFTTRVGHPVLLVPSAGDAGMGALITIAVVGAVGGGGGVLFCGELPQPPSARRRLHTLVARRFFFIVIMWNKCRGFR